MGEVVSFVGQKGGTGKSTLARAFAVQAARAGVNTLIADLDDAQRTSLEWGQRRQKAGFQPIIRVERMNRLNVFTKAAGVDLLVVDAPGWADESTLWLAQGSQLTVLPVGTSVDDLNPTIRLMHEFAKKGVQEWRLAITLMRLHNERDGEFARGYLGTAGFKGMLLAHELAENALYRQAQDQGLAITEVADRRLAREAAQVLEDVAKALERAGAKQKSLEKQQGPARLVPRKDRER
jgi:chromosome partitioning protein